MERYEDEKKNIAIVHQEANISVPIAVKPRINAKDAISYCDGNPVIRKRSYQRDYRGKLDYGFVLSQNICIDIPIEFSADTIVKDAYIDGIIPD